MSTQHWPVVVVTFPAAFSERDLQRHLLECEPLLSRGDTFLCIRDLTQIKQVPDAGVRRAAASWEQRHQVPLGRVLLGVANVSDSKLVRGALTAMRWLSSAPYPEVSLSTLQEAFQWAETLLSERGLPVPDHVRKQAI